MGRDGRAKTSRAKPLDAEWSQGLEEQRQAVWQKVGQRPAPVVFDPDPTGLRARYRSGVPCV